MQILEENNLDFTIVEYLKKPPTKKELISIGDALQLKPKNFLRKGEKIYKELCIDINKTNSDQLYHLISKYPILMERPIIIKGNKGVIGRPPENILTLI